MPAVVSCPSCQRQLRVPDELLGQQIKCPQCGGQFAADAGQAPAPNAAVTRRPDAGCTSGSTRA